MNPSDPNEQSAWASASRTGLLEFRGAPGPLEAGMLVPVWLGGGLAGQFCCGQKQVAVGVTIPHLRGDVVPNIVGPVFSLPHSFNCSPVASNRMCKFMQVRC